MSKLQEEMSKRDRGATGTKNNLAKLFRRILSKVGMTASKIEDNNRRFVRNPLNCIPDDSSKRSSAAGNIRKEIERDKMTWRVFEKLIRWLNPESAKVIVVITWKDGKQTVDSINLRIDHVDDEIETDDLEDRQVCDLTNEEMMDVLKQRGYTVPVRIEGLEQD